MARHSYSTLCIRYCLIWLLLSMITIQLNHASNEEPFSSSIDHDNNHLLDRRDSKKVAQMLQQILRRGELQLQPSRIQELFQRLHRREVND